MGNYIADNVSDFDIDIGIVDIDIYCAPENVPRPGDAHCPGLALAQVLAAVPG